MKTKTQILKESINKGYTFDFLDGLCFYAFNGFHYDTSLFDLKDIFFITDLKY